MPSIYITCTRLSFFPSETGITKAFSAYRAQLCVLQRSFQSLHLVVVSITSNNIRPRKLAVDNGGSNTAFHTQCRTPTSFSLLAAHSAANTSSQFCFSAFTLAQGFHKETTAPRMLYCTFFFLAHLSEVWGYCQVFYLNFVTCEKIHCKYLSLTGIFIILNVCNSPP